MFPAIIPLIGGGWELIDKKSASDSATLEISWTKNYELVLGIAYDIDPATDGEELWMRTSADGSAYDSGASDYAWGVINGGISEGNSSDSKIQCLGSTGGNEGMSSQGALQFSLMAPYDAGSHTMMAGCGGMLGPTATRAGTFYGRRAADAAVNGVQFLMSSGNLTTMELMLFGLLRTR